MNDLFENEYSIFFLKNLMNDIVIFPKIEDVNKLYNGARQLVEDANVVDILSTYASNCSKQIHDFCIDNAIRKKKESIDFLSSLPAPIEMGLVSETPDLKPNQLFFKDQGHGTLNPQPVLSTSYPVISIAKSWSQTNFLAGSLNSAFYFSHDSFLFNQISRTASNSTTSHQPSQLSTTFYPPGNLMSFCRNVCFHPSDILCGISKENSVYLYDIISNNESESSIEDEDSENIPKHKMILVSSLKNIHQSCITGLVFSPDGSHFVTSSLDCTIKTYDIVRSEAIYNINIKNQATYLDSSPDGRFVALTTDTGNLILFDDRQEGSTTNIPAHKYWASTLSFNNNSQLLVTAGSDKSIAIFDIRQPMSTIFRFYKHAGTPISTCFDSSDRVWSSTTAGELQSWNLCDGKNVFGFNFGETDSNEDNQSNAIYKILFVEASNSIVYSIGNGELRLMNLGDVIFSMDDQSVFNFV